MSIIDVCACVAFSEGKLLLATRRSGSDLADKWEFPGGKCEPGEALAVCIRREIREELSAVVKQTHEIATLTYAYPQKTVRLHFMICELRAASEIAPREGQKAVWYTCTDIPALELAPADNAFITLVQTPQATRDSVQSWEITDGNTISRLGEWLRGERKDGVLLAKPNWLHTAFTGGKERLEMHQLLAHAKLHTVCEGAKCPNICDCWKRKTATFMVLGDTCTRNCRFCAVPTGHPLPPDPEEPQHIAESVKALGLKYAVITCVTRDDLPDGGAQHMADVVKAVRTLTPDTEVEVLVSDYEENHGSIETVLHSGIRVYGHNLETVKRLTPDIRSKASYTRSLAVLKYAADHAPEGCLVKSGLMLGLGETADEIREALQDLRKAGVSIVTLGQYLQPTPANVPVERMIPPEEFDEWKRYAEQELGFRRAVAGPLVRSSYLAEEALKQ